MSKSATRQEQGDNEGTGLLHCRPGVGTEHGKEIASSKSDKCSAQRCEAGGPGEAGITWRSGVYTLGLIGCG